MEDEQKIKQQESDQDSLPYITTAQEALTALTQTYLDLYKKEESKRPPADSVKAAEELLNKIYDKAKKLGASNYETAEAALAGMPKSVQLKHFREWEDENIYGGKKALTPRELMDLKDEFKL